MNNERRTGATDAQIVAAVDRELDEVYSFPWDDSESKRDLVYASIRNAAEFLVPLGQVIVDAARVPTDDELAAMGNVASWTAHFAKDGTLGPELKRSAELVRAYLERRR